jgi:hypothetical protein
MDHDDRYAIPAANIGDTDLAAVARTPPAAAEEIARIEQLMNRGEETKEEFLQLCQLLFDVGSVAASEILLRRNLDHYEGHDLYVRLFGTTKQEEFQTAIEVFQSQFEVELWSASGIFLFRNFKPPAGRRGSTISSFLLVRARSKSATSKKIRSKRT